MTSLTEIVGALYECGRVAWWADYSADEYHETVSLIGDDGTETAVELSVDPDRKALFVERFLTDPVSLEENVQLINLCYVALATANMALCDNAHIGTCHMDVQEELCFVYASPIPLLCDAQTAAALVLNSLTAIRTVEPFFRDIAKKIDADQLTLDDVFSFRTETKLTVEIHPLLKIAGETKDAFRTWLTAHGLSTKLLANLFHGSEQLKIYNVVTDAGIGIYISNGRANIKVDAFVAELVRDREAFSQRIKMCWNVYLAMAAWLRLPRSDKYASCDDLAGEIESLF